MKNDEKEKPKLKNSAVKKTLILGNSIIKNIDGWRLNQRIKSIVSVRSICGATIKAMKRHVIGYLEEGSPDTIYCIMGQMISEVKNQLRRLRVT